MRRLAAREDGPARRALSHASACNPPTASAPTWTQGNTKAAGFPLFHLSLSPLRVPPRADPSGLGHATTVYSSVQGPPGVETPTVGAPGRGLLRVDEQLPIKLQMGSLPQPFRPRTKLRFGSLEFMSLDGSYDMILLPPPRDSNNGGHQPARRRRNQRRLPLMAEEQHPSLSRHLPRRRRRRRGRHGQAGGGTSSAVERVDGGGAPTGDTSGFDLTSETKTGAVSPQHASPKQADDASTLVKDLLSVSLVPETTVQSVPDATLPPSTDQEGKAATGFQWGQPEPGCSGNTTPSNAGTIHHRGAAYPGRAQESPR
jgi:hypothetical protein